MKNVCIKNLRQIEAAKEEWALANKKVNGEELAEVEVDKLIKGGVPTCPAGGTYTYGPVGVDPTCSIAKHKLP